MDETPTTFYFDFTDPLSFLVARSLADLAATATGELIWHPFELRPPPTPLIGVDDPSFAARWSTARERAPDVPFAPPRLVPWTRKAHELVAYAAEDVTEDGTPAAGSTADTNELAELIRGRLFEAYHLEGRDIGRVDVLVDLAVGAGLDRTRTKAVLDVDRHEAAISSGRDAALAEGIDQTPTVVRGGTRLEGFHDRAALGTLLGTPDPRRTT